ncbi:hypothetical protein FRC08_006354 [Ceratobasidium sp. 394]|nr:hypothetical protein FRC08_006354 [Ceratobasidium sp. 394]
MANHVDQSALTGPVRSSRKAEGDASDSEYQVVSRRYVQRKQAEESMERIEITEILGAFDSEEEGEDKEPIGNEVLPPDLAVSAVPNRGQGTQQSRASERAVAPDVVQEQFIQEAGSGIMRRKSGRRAATRPEYVSAMAELKKGSTRRK